jgi:hypothetical protein
MLLPYDILYTVCEYLTLKEYLYYSRSMFVPVLAIARPKRIVWCRSRIQLAPFRNGKCSDVACSKRKLICFQTSSVVPAVHVLSNYCAPHTRQYLNVTELLELL